MLQYKIVNLVASANLNATLDLYNLAITVPNIEYEPEQFPGAILKLKEPKVSMLLFKNGKVICSGASSEGEISMAVYKASKLIHEIQKTVKIQKNAEFQVVNLVATANLNMTLDLFKTAMALDNVEYEPEQFPGAILRITEPKLTLLLFKNGKLICAGAKREEFLRKGLKKAAELIKEVNLGVKELPEEPDEEEELGVPAHGRAPAMAATKKTWEAIPAAGPAMVKTPKAKAVGTAHIGRGKKPPAGAKARKAKPQVKKAVKKPAARAAKPKARGKKAVPGAKPKHAKKVKAKAKHAKRAAPKKHAKRAKKAGPAKKSAGKKPRPAAEKKRGLFGRLLGR